jgi:hypothetical protein
MHHPICHFEILHHEGCLNDKSVQYIIQWANGVILLLNANPMIFMSCH